jgi:hypothetical protein
MTELDQDKIRIRTGQDLRLDQGRETSRSDSGLFVRRGRVDPVQHGPVTEIITIGVTARLESESR